MGVGIEAPPRFPSPKDDEAVVILLRPDYAASRTAKFGVHHERIVDPPDYLCERAGARWKSGCPAPPEHRRMLANAVDVVECSDGVWRSPEEA